MFNYVAHNLNDSNFLEKLTEKVDKIEFYNDTNEALKILRELKRGIKRNEEQINGDLLGEYKKAMARLKFIMFLSLSDKEIEELFRNYLVIGIKMVYIDLLEALKTRISFIPLPDRDEYKKRIIKIILENREEITKESIEVDGRKIRPTVSMWLKIYNKDLGTGPVKNLDQSKFFIKNKNFIKLTDLEKLELKELFSIYEYLKKSSMTLEGNEDNEFIEDVGGGMHLLKNGKFLDIPLEKFNKLAVNRSLKAKNEDDLEYLQKAVDKYPLGSLERKAIEEEISKLKTISKK